jgi:hypothetical protein
MRNPQESAGDTCFQICLDLYRCFRNASSFKIGQHCKCVQFDTSAVSLQHKVNSTSYEIPKCVQYSLPALFLGQQEWLSEFIKMNSVQEDDSSCSDHLFSAVQISDLHYRIHKTFTTGRYPEADEPTRNPNTCFIHFSIIILSFIWSGFRENLRRKSYASTSTA